MGHHSYIIAYVTIEYKQITNIYNRFKYFKLQQSIPKSTNAIKINRYKI